MQNIQGSITFNDNRVVGHGDKEIHTIEYENGSIYKGELLHGEPHGYGSMTDPINQTVYTGHWHQGQRHGTGRCSYGFVNDDDVDYAVYTGEWRYNERHGTGEYSYRWDTCHYRGEWQNDKRCGNGSASYADGRFYDGQWDDDEQHGYGRMDYLDDKTYVGEWVHGKRCGQGTASYDDGSSFTGQWDNDVRGRGVRTYSNNTRDRGEWIHNDWHSERDAGHHNFITRHLGALLQDVIHQIRTLRDYLAHR